MESARKVYFEKASAPQLNVKIHTINVFQLKFEMQKRPALSKI